MRCLCNCVAICNNTLRIHHHCTYNPQYFPAPSLIIQTQRIANKRAKETTLQITLHLYYSVSPDFCPTLQVNLNHILLRLSISIIQPEINNFNWPKECEYQPCFQKIQPSTIFACSEAYSSNVFVQIPQSAILFHIS